MPAIIATVLFAVSLSLLPAATAADWQDQEWVKMEMDRQQERRVELRRLSRDIGYEIVSFVIRID